MSKQEYRRFYYPKFHQADIERQYSMSRSILFYSSITSKIRFSDMLSGLVIIAVSTLSTGCAEHQREVAQSNDRSKTDVVVSSSGLDSSSDTLGTNKEYAVEVCDISGEDIYLRRLRCEDGTIPSIVRAGNAGTRNSPKDIDPIEILEQTSKYRPIPDGVEDQHIIDLYKVQCGENAVDVYFDMYHCMADPPQTAISGFSMTAEEPQDLAKTLQPPCKVKDPDIGTTYRGDCADGYADGYGIAMGRDEYQGEFYKGMPHGKGIYTWGASSDWATERHEGFFGDGLKDGFGVTTVSIDSNHIDLEWYKENTSIEQGKYVLRGLFVDHHFVLACDSPLACQEEIERRKTAPEI